MFRTTDIILIAAMVSAAAFTYTTKHGAEAELSKLRQLQASIRFEEETIDVLKADWSLLTQPGRLQRLADAYQSELGLAPVEPYQYADLGELPAPRPVEVDDPSAGALDGIADNGIDPVPTGAVR